MKYLNYIVKSRYSSRSGAIKLGYYSNVEYTLNWIYYKNGIKRYNIKIIDNWLDKGIWIVVSRGIKEKVKKLKEICNETGNNG